MTLNSRKLPKIVPVTVDIHKCALLVLDISQRCADPSFRCHELAPSLKGFLDRVRQVGLPIIFTISTRLMGTPEGEVYSLLARRPCEPVIYPDAFDKFAGGELESFLSLCKADTLIITGYRSNISVLNTATKATRELKYNVIIPIDGLSAKSDYEQEYTLFQMSVLPAQAASLFRFTSLDKISFE